MKQVLSVLMMTLVIGLVGCGGEKPEPKPEDDGAEAKPDAAAVEVVNANCPICGMKSDPSLGTIEYEGKQYGVGCAACLEPFKKDPAKYVKMIEDAKKAAEDAPATQPADG